MEGATCKDRAPRILAKEVLEKGGTLSKERRQKEAGSRAHLLTTWPRAGGLLKFQTNHSNIVLDVSVFFSREGS